MRCRGTTKAGRQCMNTRACRHHISFNFLDDTDNVEERPQVYCGTSLLLPDDYDVFGTRNKCLKKGVGIGMGASDSTRQEFLYKPYVPKPEKLYCGDAEVLPAGYTGFGDLSVCLKKGVGAGLLMDQARRLAFQAKPKAPLGKKELMELAQRLGITNINGKTREAVELEISRKIYN